jgi:hypothetical protein
MPWHAGVVAPHRFAADRRLARVPWDQHAVRVAVID